MSDWLFWVGVVVAGFGAFLLSPLADFLPVELWDSLKAFFQGDSSHRYLRAVPGESSRMLEFILVGVGLALVAIGYYLRESK
jgi:hypothetical protein